MIGIVPAAGYATRLGKLSSSKEMLEIDGAPVIEHLLQRLQIGGCTEIRVVARPEKVDLCAYVERRGVRLVLAHPRHLGESVAAGLAGVGAQEIVALGYPDTLWEPRDGYARLRDVLEEDDELDVVLGLFETPEAARSDVVRVDKTGRVVDILVKPEDPPSPLVYGCLVARRSALFDVGAHEWPTDALRPSIARRRVGSLFLSSRWLDIGTPDALARALGSPNVGS